MLLCSRWSEMSREACSRCSHIIPSAFFLFASIFYCLKYDIPCLRMHPDVNTAVNPHIVCLCPLLWPEAPTSPIGQGARSLKFRVWLAQPNFAAASNPHFTTDFPVQPIHVPWSPPPFFVCRCDLYCVPCPDKEGHLLTRQLFHLPTYLTPINRHHVTIFLRQRE